MFAETCPQYLFMTGKDVDKPGIEGAKWMCSPPPRTEADQEAIWQGLALGDLQVVSSDHAPYAFDATGKLMAGPNPTFKQIANGMPGIEARLPVLFDAMVSKGRLGLQKFVELTATAPAKIYNLHPRKGSIAIGADADIVLWDPKRQVTLADSLMHDGARYTPYAGRTVTGWPETVLRRGEVIVQRRQARGQARVRRLASARGRRRGRPARPPDRRHGPRAQLRREIALRWRCSRTPDSAPKHRRTTFLLSEVAADCDALRADIAFLGMRCAATRWSPRFATARAPRRR